MAASLPVPNFPQPSMRLVIKKHSPTREELLSVMLAPCDSLHRRFAGLAGLGEFRSSLPTRPPVVLCCAIQGLLIVTRRVTLSRRPRINGVAGGHDLLQNIQAHGLDQVRIEAGCAGVLDICGLPVTGQGNDPDWLAGIAHMARDLIAIHL